MSEIYFVHDLGLFGPFTLDYDLWLWAGLEPEQQERTRLAVAEGTMFVDGQVQPEAWTRCARATILGPMQTYPWDSEAMDDA